MGWFRGSSKPSSSSKPQSLQAQSLGKAAAANLWQQKLELYEREEWERPEYWNTPEAQAEAKDDGYFRPSKGATPEQIEKSRSLAQQISKSGMVQFLLRSEEIAAQQNVEALASNSRPTWKEDVELWKQLPLVPGPYNGPPMPRLAINGMQAAQRTFWDFFKQFQFGLWGYRQRPYPPEKPLDVQQALGYKWLDKRYFDFAMRSGGWYYKDRLGRTRGPMELVNLKTAWAAGIVDKSTFIWGDDMDEWAPIGMIFGLEQAINTPDMKLAAAGSDIVHKLARGLAPWTPKKGHEAKSYKQLQTEALDQKEREKAVLRLNGGVWPGERAPSHSMFLWASGSELTTILEEGKKTMPDKFVPYAVRKRLAQEIPGLRPWEILEFEHLMDFMTYNGDWYREDLGSFTTRADYEREWFEDFKEKWDDIYEEVEDVFAKTDKEALISELKRLSNKEKS